MKFNASVPAGSIARKARGRPPLLNAIHRAARVEAIERKPIPAGSHDEIVNHCCDAWNKMVEQPWKIMSFGLRNRAQIS